MNFSDHFHRVHEIAGALPEEARALLRDAEEHSSSTIALHWCLCAEGWLNSLRDADNARRCLLYAETLMWNDVRELLILAECWLILFADTKAAHLCLKKALHFAATEDDNLRIEDFRQKFCVSGGILLQEPEPC